MTVHFSPGSKLISYTKGAVYCCLGMALLSILIYSGWYICTGYAQLSDWFHALNPCFYRSAEFTTYFFTPAVKRAGNLYFALAICISFAGLWALFLHVKKSKLKTAAPIKISIALPVMLLSTVIVFFCCIMWHMGNKAALPAFDEVFSAQNVAGIHSFQGVSYYMLPNNHLLFNLLNNTLFPHSLDHVATGRTLSLLAYVLFALSVFACTLKVSGNRLLSLLLTLAAASQFFVWGFSFQARGYECYLLASGLLFISLFGYVFSEKKYWLYINVIACAAGYFIMPSFLYFHAGQLLFMTLYQITQRKGVGAFWIAQVISFTLVFICYLPALCFSGRDAITSNHYVAPMGTYKTTYAFMQWMFPYFRTYLAHMLSNSHPENITLSLCAAIVPFALLLAKRNSRFFLAGLFYAAIWLMFFLLVIAMKRLPFERNLAAHYSLSFICLVITFYWLMGFKNKLAPKIKVMIASTVVLAFGIHFYKTNATLIDDTLYEYNVNYACHLFGDALKRIPAGSIVTCSDEGFYYGYLCRKNGCEVHPCPTGNEQYYIKQNFEQLPPLLAPNFELLTNLNEMEIYRRKK